MALLFAHRGARAHEPENTIPAFQRALNFGVTGLESDVWVTADGVAVLDHDGDDIATSLRQELPAHIPDIDEFYDLVPDNIAVSLDIKDVAALTPVVEAARRRDVDHQLWLCYEELHDLTALDTGVGRATLVHSTYVGFMPDGFEQHVRTLAHASVGVLNMHYTEWSPDRLDCVQDAGLMGFAWDIQHADAMKKLLQMGIDGVFSDHSNMMVDVADSLGITTYGAPSRQ